MNAWLRVGPCVPALLSTPPSPTLTSPPGSRLLQVDSAKQRFSVTLKPSLTATSDAALLRSLFTDFELAAELQAAQDVAAGESAIDWAADVAIGSTIDVQVRATAVCYCWGGCTWCLWWSCGGAVDRLAALALSLHVPAAHLP